MRIAAFVPEQLHSGTAEASEQRRCAPLERDRLSLTPFRAAGSNVNRSLKQKLKA
jgi:hypothetical protein